MLSYLKSVQTLVSTEIFKRGVRYYLDGNVINFRRLILENWRSYKVKGTEDYYVKIPVLHLIIDRSKFELLPKAIEESASCNCPYFTESEQICKHIIAVCNHMDNEFFEVPGKPKMENLIQGSILENIFVAEKSRKSTLILAKFEEYFEKSSTNLFWFEKIIFDLNHDKQMATKVLIELKGDFSRRLRVFEYEKKIFLLVATSLRIGNKFWWAFWQSLLPEFSEQCRLKIWSEIWGMRRARLTMEYNEEINSYVATLNEQEKYLILERLKRDYENNTKLWLDFVLSSHYTAFLIENLDKFDAAMLIEICPMMPEERDNIDLKILNQVRVWSDFLLAGEYNELLETLSKWSALGKSETFMEAVKYIKETHKKKKKLMTGIMKIIEN
jgi:hypothetical protein